MASALTFQPSYETPEKDEAQTQSELVETMTKIQEKTYADGGHGLRSVHAKSHGLLKGELRVLSDLPEELAQGLFSTAARYPVVIRLSTNPGDLLDDSVSTPRGMALKVVGVKGPRLPGTEDDATQDFVMVNGPAFLKKDGKSFLSGLKLLAATTDRAPALKKVLSATLRGAESLVETAGGRSPTLISLGGHPETHLLGETFYSATPLLYGRYMAKVCVAPISPSLTALTNKPLDVNGKPNALREAVVDFFASQDAEWELRVQLCTDLEKMPIENAKVVWPEELSPYRAVARIVVPRQVGWSETRSKLVDDRFSFSPWHALAAHRPLGSVNRLRKAAYEMSRRFRAAKNEVSAEEPHSLERFPD